MTGKDSLEPTLRRISWRVAPLLVLLYLITFLDRVNVGFAALTMNRDLGISEGAYGLAAGVFFAGYLVFSVPSSLMLARFGARRWIAVIMVWGIVSSMQVFIHGAVSYTIARFLIGAAEAGFFPGIILYISTWLPRSHRTGLMGLFTVSIPLATIVGAPLLSTHLMQLGGLFGLRGWQWLFLLEGIPAVFLGIMLPRLLSSGPENAHWLTPQEKANLLDTIFREESDAPSLARVRGFSSLLRIAGVPAAPISS